MLWGENSNETLDIELNNYLSDCLPIFYTLEEFRP